MAMASASALIWVLCIGVVAATSECAAPEGAAPVKADALLQSHRAGQKLVSKAVDAEGREGWVGGMASRFAPKFTTYKITVGGFNGQKSATCSTTAQINGIQVETAGRPFTYDWQLGATVSGDMTPYGSKMVTFPDPVAIENYKLILGWVEGHEYCQPETWTLSGVSEDGAEVLLHSGREKHSWTVDREWGPYEAQLPESVLQTLIEEPAPQALPESPAKYRCYFFKATKVDVHNSLQQTLVAEFKLFRNGQPLNLEGKIKTGMNDVSSGNAGDNNIDTNWGAHVGKTLDICFDEPTEVDSYTYVTADSVTTKDPLRWELHGGYAWGNYGFQPYNRLLHEMVEDYPVPWARHHVLHAFPVPRPFLNEVMYKWTPTNIEYIGFGSTMSLSMGKVFLDVLCITMYDEYHHEIDLSPVGDVAVIQGGWIKSPMQVVDANSETKFECREASVELCAITFIMPGPVPISSFDVITPPALAGGQEMSTGKVAWTLSAKLKDDVDGEWTTLVTSADDSEDHVHDTGHDHEDVHNHGHEGDIGHGHEDDIGHAHHDLDDDAHLHVHDHYHHHSEDGPWPVDVTSLHLPAMPPPTPEPTPHPTDPATPEPSLYTTEAPPTPEPTGAPTPEPTPAPTLPPTHAPTPPPTPEPTPPPTLEPTPEPTAEPTLEPTTAPQPALPPTPALPVYNSCQATVDGFQAMMAEGKTSVPWMYDCAKSCAWMCHSKCCRCCSGNKGKAEQWNMIGGIPQCFQSFPTDEMSPGWGTWQDKAPQ